MDLISVVVPCFNEEEMIPIFYKEILKTAEEMKEKNEIEFEYIFTDDGSKDKSINILRDLHNKDKRVRYISFSRNFGKESGIYAGLEAAKGDYIVTMDVDLQDPPALLPEMYNIIKTLNTTV